MASTPNSATKTSPGSPRQHRQSTWDSEMDTDALFTNHSVEEIRLTENKTRGDIEKKKEDLRMMVGERYRDLIDAADTITDMKTSANQITSFIQDIQMQCKDLHQSHRCHGVAGPQTERTGQSLSQSKSGFYAIASQMKLLVDTPEKVWSALERRLYLKATQLYLFSHHIVSILHIDTGSSSAPKVLSSFPILPKQWAAISHFKNSILQGSRSMLKDVTQTEEILAESLSSILLLEESSPRQVFTEFLLARKSALQEIFHPSQHASSIKSQVCEVVKVIRATLYHMHALFYCGESSGMDDKDKPALLFRTLDQVTKREESPNTDEDALEALFGPDFDLVTSARYLPKSVLCYRPHIRTFSSAISVQNIQSNSSEWITMCIKDVSGGVRKLLQYVGTLKSLAFIRDAVWAMLQEEQVPEADGIALDWQTLCTQVLGRELSIWDNFLRPLFLERAKAILHGLFDATISSCKNMINKSQDDFSNPNTTDTMALWERDIAGYVWHESPNDVPLSAMWRPQNTNTTSQGRAGGGLTLKAQACTPAAQRLCTAIDDRLSATVDDTRNFVMDIPHKDSAQGVRAQSSSSDLNFLADGKSNMTGTKNPFDRFGDAKEIQCFLQDTCFTSVTQLLGFMDEILHDHQRKLISSVSSLSASSFDTTNVDRVLFVGRLCQSITEQCPHLKLIMQEEENETKNKLTPRRRSTRKKVDHDKDSRIAELTKLLKQRHSSAFRLWKDWVSTLFLSSFDASLLHGGEESALLSITSWEEIKIEEETEAGKKVQSTIRVPMQVSSQVMSLLFSLCQELNRIGGHALDRYLAQLIRDISGKGPTKRLLQELVCVLSTGVMSTYEKLLKEQKSAGLPQNRALQLMFDLKFLSAIFAGRTDNEEEAAQHARCLQRIVDTLEGFVDPFDLDVFSPYIATNLNRQLQRCGVLFGVLASLDKHSSHSFGVTSRPTPGSQAQHNIMPLAPNPPRFPLLPLSSHQSDVFESAKEKKIPTTAQGNVKSPVNKTAFFQHSQFFNLEQTVST